MICELQFTVKGERNTQAILNSGLEFKKVFTSRSDFMEASFGGTQGKMKGQCFKVQVFPSNKAQINGNLHYYFNNGIHNANDFNYFEVLRCIDEICRILNIQCEEAFINGIEFGVNISPFFKLWQLFQNLLVLGKEVCKKDEKHESYSFRFSQYSIKIYDKEVMFPHLGKNLRIELHVKKMQVIRKSVPDLKTLGDLKDIRILKMLRDDLLSRIKSVLIKEEMDFGRMSTSQKARYASLSSKSSWIGISAEKRRVQKRAFLELTETYSLSSTAKGLMVCLQKKFEELFQVEHMFLPDVSVEKSHVITACEMRDLPMNLPLVVKGKNMVKCKVGNIECYVGESGSFYVRHPLQSELFALYSSITFYNLRLDRPTYFHREEVANDFIHPCKLDLEELIASRV